MAIEPPKTEWRFPPVEGADENGVVGLGADLEPGTVLAAYRHGLFPMPAKGEGTIAWWSPNPRAVLPLDGLHISRSLRRSLGRFEARVDTAFDEVIEACADPRRPHGWIDEQVKESYRTLHEMGWVHSVETWDHHGNLVGGLYGVAIGGLFAGESMFHRATDASKAALVHLVDILRDDHGQLGEPTDRLLDVQWQTPHLASLGCIDVSRPTYLERLAVALNAPLPAAFR